MKSVFSKKRGEAVLGMDGRTSLVAVVLVAASCFVWSGGEPAWSQKWKAGMPGGMGGDSRKSQGFMFLQQGMRLHQGGDVSGAIEMYKRSLSHDPRNKYAHYYLANAYSQSGNKQAALQSFKTALNNDYNFIEARNDYAVTLLELDDRQNAMIQFMETVKINPQYPFPYYYIGKILQDRGDLDGAIGSYETAARLKPDYFEAQRDLGLAIFEKAKTGTGADMSHALEKLQIAARLVPDNPMIHYHMAEIYCADGKLDDAEAEFRRTLMLEPRHAAAHWELAKLRYFRGDLDRCIAECKEAEKINPTYTDSRGYPKIDPMWMKFSYAVCYEVKGKMIPAVEAWKEVSQMVFFNRVALKHIADIEKFLRKEAKKKKKPLPYDPEEIDALVAKGIRQYDDGDLEGARATFQRAMELNPQSFEATQNLGAVLEAMGDLNGALAKYQAAMAIKPEFDGAYYNLAYLLEKMNLPADAGLMYQKFHEVSVLGKYPYDPKHIVALQQEEARERARQEQIRRRGY